MTTYMEQSQQQMPYSTSIITSYIIPFVGPHECPDSKKCPNNMSRKQTNQPQQDIVSSTRNEENKFEEKNEGSNSEQKCSEAKVENNIEPIDIDINNLSECEKTLQQDEKRPKNCRYSFFMESTTCPYPLSVVWWKTCEGVNRAIIGYSDGSICFVGLSPNCPFVASTNINEGAVVKLVKCGGKIYENVILLVNYIIFNFYPNGFHN